MLRVSALEYIRKVEDGEFTAEEFAAETLRRIRGAEPRIHAYLHVEDESRVLEQARAVDRGLRSGRPPQPGGAGRCMGMPMSIKDNICVRGARTTCGSRMLEEYVSPYDSTAVSRLRSEGALIIAKANMDEFAMGLTTEFSAFGPSRNPWNEEYVPGGSSGGSAAATAALECVASLGSDTGGSVRNPASFCSVVGYKPTYGLISRYGLVSYANSIEQIGPIARTVSDVAFLLEIIAGYDPHDGTTIRPVPDAAGGPDGDSTHSDIVKSAAADVDCPESDAAAGFLAGIDDGIEGMRIGVVGEMSYADSVDAQVARAARGAVRDLESAGAECGEVSLDMIKYSVPAYYTITAAEAQSNLARYDNIRYGYERPLEGYEFNSYVEEARSMLGPEVARRMIVGGYVASAGHSGKYYLKAQQVQQALSRELRDAFCSYDILISPTVPVLPFKLGEKIDDPVALFMVDMNTVTANLTHVPAISVPYAMSGEGLPIGIQMMAGYLQDKKLLRAARALESRASLPEVPD